MHSEQWTILTQRPTKITTSCRKAAACISHCARSPVNLEVKNGPAANLTSYVKLICLGLPDSPSASLFNFHFIALTGVENTLETYGIIYQEVEETVFFLFRLLNNFGFFEFIQSQLYAYLWNALVEQYN